MRGGGRVWLCWGTECEVEAPPARFMALYSRLLAGGSYGFLCLDGGRGGESGGEADSTSLHKDSCRPNGRTPAGSTLPWQGRGGWAGGLQPALRVTSLSSAGVTPRSGWAVDPFGHSATMPYLLRRANLTSMLIQRVHYAIKKHFAATQNLEFIWRQSWGEGLGTLPSLFFPSIGRPPRNFYSYPTLINFTNSSRQQMYPIHFPPLPVAPPPNNHAEPGSPPSSQDVLPPHVI